MKQTIVQNASLCISCLCTPLLAQATPDRWKAVDAALGGRAGQMQPGDVYKYCLRRRDLKVTKDGTTIAPGLALGSWAAFKMMGNEAMVTGDLVLTEEEIEPVLLQTAAGGHRAYVHP